MSCSFPVGKEGDIMKRSPHDKYKVRLTEQELQETNNLIKKGICKARTITREKAKEKFHLS